MEGTTAPAVSSTSTQSTSQPSSPGLGVGNQKSTPSNLPPLTNQKEGGSQSQPKDSVLSKPATPPAPEMYDVKVNGKMVKMSRQEVLDHASMSYAANDRFNEAKKLRSQVDKLVSTAKQNPIQALLDPALGLTKDEIRNAVEDWYHKEYIEPDTLSEEQKRMRSYEQKLKQYEEEAASKKRQSEEQEHTRLTNQQRELIQNQIVEGMEASGLPKTKFFASRMAFYMRQNAVNGWDAPMEMIVKQVKNERAQIMSDMSEGATAEQLISLLGDSVINKIRSYDLERLRAKRNLPPPTQTSQHSNAGTGVQKEKLSPADVQRRLRDIRMGKF